MVIFQKDQKNIKSLAAIFLLYVNISNREHSLKKVLVLNIKIVCLI